MCLQTLSHCHGAGICHSDVKPANFLYQAVSSSIDSKPSGHVQEAMGHYTQRRPSNQDPEHLCALDLNMRVLKAIDFGCSPQVSHAHPKLTIPKVRAVAMLGPHLCFHGSCVACSLLRAHDRRLTSCCPCTAIFQGTPVSSAPELYMRSYSSEADIWSCGMILHHLLTGKLPFWDSPLDDLTRKQVSTASVQKPAAFL